MHLIDFINTYLDWKVALTLPPYNLKITNDNDLYMLKYNQISSDFSYQEVCEARGCIVFWSEMNRRWIYACRPFDKFFNYGESYAANINWSKASASKKIDGSLIKVFYHNEWKVATNGTIDAYKATANEVTNLTFGELFERAILRDYDSMEDFYSTLDEWSTYMFELVSPYSQVVLYYDSTECYYLGSRRPTTGEYWDDARIKVQRPTNYEAHSLDEILTLVHQWETTIPSVEGLVVFDGINRIKCKTETYLRMHYVVNNGKISWERLMDIVLNNEVDEFIVYLAQYRLQIDRINEKQHGYKIMADTFRQYCEQSVFKTKKDFARFIIRLPNWLKAYLFKWYDKHLTWDEYTNDWDAATWVKVLELREK